MKRFAVIETPIAGLKVIQRQPIGDDRGFLCRLFCSEELASVGWQKPIAQINHTLTAKQGTIRGLHFQIAPHPEKKLVSCLKGRVWDVAIDLRDDSPTRYHWHAEELSADNHKAMLIPEGFAHGFQSLDDGCELLYCHSAHFHPESERGLRFDDPWLGIAWPLPLSEISDRDLKHPYHDGKE